MESRYDSESEESGSSGTGWVEWFTSQRGNEYFTQVDEDYILDRFNLTGLVAEVPHAHFQPALDLITDNMDLDLDPPTWEIVDRAAKHLYGLIHARWVITAKGLALMAEKIKRKEFGKCQRVLCEDQFVIPVAVSDVPGLTGVKLYCPKCQDIYNPPKKQTGIDGAYFTTSLPHLLLQMHPSLIPQNPTTRYTPKIFGFKIHSIAEEHRFQDAVKQEMTKRRKALAERLEE